MTRKSAISVIFNIVISGIICSSTSILLHMVFSTFNKEIRIPVFDKEIFLFFLFFSASNMLYGAVVGALTLALIKIQLIKSTKNNFEYFLVPPLVVIVSLMPDFLSNTSLNKDMAILSASMIFTSFITMKKFSLAK